MIIALALKKNRLIGAICLQATTGVQRNQVVVRYADDGVNAGYQCGVVGNHAG